jgi:hypothetical protein
MGGLKEQQRWVVSDGSGGGGGGHEEKAVAFDERYAAVFPLILCFYVLYYCWEEIAASFRNE